MGVDHRPGIDREDALFRGVHLIHTEGCVGGDDLAVEVGDVHRVVIDQVQCPHAASRQGLHTVTAHAADAKNGNAGALQLLHGLLAKEQLRS